VLASLDFENVTDETLLAARLCDLPIKLEDTLMARRVARLPARRSKSISSDTTRA